MTQQINKVAQALNTQGKDIRREGDVPRFHNDLVALVAGKTMTFEYNGNFEFAEVIDNLLVIHYDGRYIKFRQDQLGNIRVD